MLKTNEHCAGGISRGWCPPDMLVCRRAEAICQTLSQVSASSWPSELTAMKRETSDGLRLQGRQRLRPISSFDAQDAQICHRALLQGQDASLQRDRSEAGALLQRNPPAPTQKCHQKRKSRVMQHVCWRDAHSLCVVHNPRIVAGRQHLDMWPVHILQQLWLELLDVLLQATRPGRRVFYGITGLGHRPSVFG